MALHQVVVSASPGDAVTSAALEFRELLRRLGESEIFALYLDPSLEGEVKSLEELAAFSRVWPSSLLLFHASIGDPAMLAFLLERPERLVVYYHNISPAEPFLPYDPAFAGLLSEGRRELFALRERTVLALAASAYNAEELCELGYQDVRVSPLVVDPHRLVDVEPDAATDHHLSSLPGPRVLFVGQQLPHKRPDLLLSAYHVLVTHIDPTVSLQLVGASRLPRFGAALQCFVNELNLHRVWLAGAVSQQRLAAFYRRADLFVTMSEHEGFCVPLLEAMAFDVPVLARRYAAIPETAGDAAVLLPEGDDPLLVAEAMAALLSDVALREEMVGRGRRRLTVFDPDRARAEFLVNLGRVL